MIMFHPSEPEQHRVIWDPDDPDIIIFQKKKDDMWINRSRYLLDPRPTHMKDLHVLMEDFFYHGMIMEEESLQAMAD